MKQKKKKPNWGAREEKKKQLSIKCKRANGHLFFSGCSSVALWLSSRGKTKTTQKQHSSLPSDFRDPQLNRFRSPLIFKAPLLSTNRGLRDMGRTYRWVPRFSPRGLSSCSTRHEALQRGELCCLV